MTERSDYYFLPYVRQGLSTSIMRGPTAPRSELNVTTHLEAEVYGQSRSKHQEVNQTLQLYGPGDVLGFDSKLVVRTDPQSNVGDFENNYFPSLEFADADFPWRFTPAPPSPDQQLMPWVSLIVLRVDSPDGATSEILSPEGRSTQNQIPYISVTTHSLPEFREAWRWAHVQITPENEETFTLPLLTKILTEEPERAIGRLLCPRRLQPGSLYRAFVVPTFEVGRLAGLEEAIPSSLRGDQTISEALDNRKDSETNPVIQLPYYYDWEFRTGSRGDFEYLVRRLEARDLSGLGVRPIRAQAPGYGLPGVGPSQDQKAEPDVVSLEGALQTVDTNFSPWGQDTEFEGFTVKKEKGNSFRFSWTTSTPMTTLISTQAAKGGRSVQDRKKRENHSYSVPVGADQFTFLIRCKELGEGGRTIQVEGSFPPPSTNLTGHNFREPFAETILNRPENRVANRQNNFPWVLPPIYGQWHAKQSKVNPYAASWVDELNLDPRHRIAGGFGAQVIRDQQEALMASAWDQVGAIDDANELIRQAQLGCELSLAIHDRMQLLNTEDYLRVVCPTMKRVRWNNKAGGTPSSSSYSIYGKLRADHDDLGHAMEPIFSRVTRPRGALRKRQKSGRTPKIQPKILDRLNSKTLLIAGTHPNPKGIIHIGKILGKNLVKPGVTAPGNVRNPKPLSGASVAKKGSFTIAQKSGAKISTVAKKVALPEPLPVDLNRLKVDVLGNALNPLTTIPYRVQRQLQLTGMPIRKKNQTLDLIMAAPQFSQPMYEALQEISQDLVLPGLEKVPNNTLALLKPNMRFIEAYMCGLNHEFSKELVWREYPTDQRGSYFRQFWDVSDTIPTGQEKSLPLAQKKYIAQQLGKKLSQLTAEEIQEERLKEILPLSEWKTTRLGTHENRWGSGLPQTESLVLLIRGDLLNKYPNTVIYAVEARDWPNGPKKRRPALPEYFDEEDASKLPSPIFPIFSAQLPSDLTFLGFPFNEEYARTGRGKSGKAKGYFFILEERISEARFGLDFTGVKSPPLNSWPDLAWEHFSDLVDEHLSDLAAGIYLNELQPKDSNGQVPEFNGKTWAKSSGSIASITLQRPVRIAVHASQMLPQTDVSENGGST